MNGEVTLSVWEKLEVNKNTGTSMIRKILSKYYDFMTKLP